ncbi:DNA hydrolase [Brachybacterium phenoliresistens]|uniref:DNA hydrolase n=1 Tax=Brachybacterium phenoliresistens TaxID=396014 RepID=Z9JNS8_9MICO|nr:NUDIX hydrolase [Brachybacterium phenoliresistens]EWS80035.1 DNA hydrolase [Brachybacterium phenoliresistens]
MDAETKGSGVSEFEQALVSVDVVAMVYSAGTLQVCLPPRQFAPFLGEAALPGVLIGRETSVQAAERALATKAGARAERLEDVGVFDTDGRDPRGPTMAIAKLALGVQPLAGTPSLHLQELGAVRGLPFDHEAIILRAAASLGRLLLTEAEALRLLFGPVLSVRDVLTVARALEQATGRAILPTDNNGIRRLLGTHGATKTGEYAAGASKGHPSALYRL